MRFIRSKRKQRLFWMERACVIAGIPTPEPEWTPPAYAESRFWIKGGGTWNDTTCLTASSPAPKRARIQPVLLAIVLAILTVALPARAWAAGCAGTGACFWVGGTGNSNSTTNWATTSGGAVTGSVPTATDDCHFDSLSNATAYTWTVNATLNCKSLLFDAEPLTSGVVTWAGSGQTANIAGGLKLLSGMTRTFTGPISFTATSGSFNITSNTKALASAITFSGNGGTWVLADAFNSSGSSFTLTAGTLDAATNNVAVTLTSFSTTGATARTLSMGSGIWTFAGASAFWTYTGSGLTLNTVAGGLITCNNGAPVFAGNGVSYTNEDLTFSAVTGTGSITGANTFDVLTLTGSGNASATVTLAADQTVTSLTASGNSAALNRLFISSDTQGTVRTLTTSTGATLTNVDLRDITASGAGSPWTGGTSVGDCAGNTNVGGTAAVTRHLVGSGSVNWSASNWSTTNGGASGASIPICQDTADIDSGSGGTRTLTVDTKRVGTIDFTGATATKTLALTSTPNTIYGSFTGNGSNVTYSGSQALDFVVRSGTNTVNVGKSVSSTCASACMPNTTINADGGTIQLTGLYPNTNGTSFTLAGGTFDANGFDVYTENFVSTSGRTRTLLLGNGSTWKLTNTAQALGTIWNTTAAGLTVTAGTSTIYATATGGAGQTFVGGGQTYYDLESVSNVTINDSNTFHRLIADNGQVNTFTLQAAKTQTVSYMTCRGSGATKPIINGTGTLTCAAGPFICDIATFNSFAFTSNACTFWAGAQSTGTATGPVKLFGPAASMGGAVSYADSSGGGAY